MAAVVLSITSCSKEDLDDNQNSHEKVLMENSPWTPVSFNINGSEFSDACLQDNTWEFQSGGVLVTKEGLNVCPGGSDINGTWSVNEAGTEFTFNVVGQFTAQINVLSSTEFRYTYTQSFQGQTSTVMYYFTN